MPLDSPLSLSTLAAILALALPLGAARAQDHIYFQVECDGGLKDAEGVIGPHHAYKIRGKCALWQMRQPEDPDEMRALLDMGETAWHDKVLVAIETIGSAAWDRASGHATESISFAGPVTGEASRVGTCMKDPFLAAVPCGPVKMAQSVTAGPHVDRLLTALYHHSAFLFGNRFTVAEAQALSAAHGKGAVPQPPEPKSPPVVDGLATRYVMIGAGEHIVRVTLRGAQPITARLSQGRGMPRPIAVDDPHPGPSQRTVALRIPAASVRQPGRIIVGLANKHGNARVELLACMPGGPGNPEGCPLRLKAGAAPPATAVAQPSIPGVRPPERTR